MKTIAWGALLAVLLSYVLLVLAFGFPGWVALGLHFSRVVIAISVLILYVPALATVFDEVPPPRRDYLVAGIILTWLSGSAFSFWNEAGRVFGVDTSIFSSYIAGFFSLLLALGGVFHLIAPPDAGGRRSKLAALVVGIALSFLLVFIAPLFR